MIEANNELERLFRLFGCWSNLETRLILEVTSIIHLAKVNNNFIKRTECTIEAIYYFLLAVSSFKSVLLIRCCC